MPFNKLATKIGVFFLPFLFSVTNTGCFTIPVLSPRTVSHELFVSSSSPTGQNKVCQNQEKVLSTSLGRYTRPRSSLARMAPSLSTAGRHMDTPHPSGDAGQQKELKSRYLPPFPPHPCREISWGRQCQTLDSASQTHLPSALALPTRL